MSSTRNTKAAQRFLGKTLNSIPCYAHPRTINTDKNSSYAKVLSQLKQEEKCPAELQHSQIKYLNNIVEFDQHATKELKQYPKDIGNLLKYDYAGLWRYRIDKFRVICHLDEYHNTILVLKIGARDQVYD